MNLLIVGAAGRTGHLLTELALLRGHKVKAIVHSSPLILTRTNLRLANLSIVRGDALNAEDLATAIQGCDVVVSILGRQAGVHGHLIEDAAAAMLKTLSGQKLRRYIVVSSGLLFASRNPFIAALRWVFKKAIADCTSMENLVRSSDVNWTIVRPPRLRSGSAAAGYRAERDARPRGAVSLTRAALATFLLDEAEHCRYPQAVVGLG